MTEKRSHGEGLLWRVILTLPNFLATNFASWVSQETPHPVFSMAGVTLR